MSRIPSFDLMAIPPQGGDPFPEPQSIVWYYEGRFRHVLRKIAEMDTVAHSWALDQLQKELKFCMSILGVMSTIGMFWAPMAVVGGLAAEMWHLVGQLSLPSAAMLRSLEVNDSTGPTSLENVYDHAWWETPLAPNAAVIDSIQDLLLAMQSTHKNSPRALEAPPAIPIANFPQTWHSSIGVLHTDQAPWSECHRCRLYRAVAVSVGQESLSISRNVQGMANIFERRQQERSRSAEAFNMLRGIIDRKADNRIKNRSMQPPKDRSKVVIDPADISATFSTPHDNDICQNATPAPPSAPSLSSSAAATPRVSIGRDRSNSETFGELDAPARVANTEGNDTPQVEVNALKPRPEIEDHVLPQAPILPPPSKSMVSPLEDNLFIGKLSGETKKKKPAIRCPRPTVLSLVGPLPSKHTEPNAAIAAPVTKAKGLLHSIPRPPVLLPASRKPLNVETHTWSPLGNIPCPTTISNPAAHARSNMALGSIPRPSFGQRGTKPGRKVADPGEEDTVETRPSTDIGPKLLRGIPRPSGRVHESLVDALNASCNNHLDHDREIRTTGHKRHR